MGFTDSEEVVAKYGYDKVATVLDWYASLEGPVEKPGALVRQAIKSEKLPKIPPMSQYDEENPPPGVPPGTPKKAWKFFRGKLSSVVKS